MTLLTIIHDQLTNLFTSIHNHVIGFGTVGGTLLTVFTITAPTIFDTIAIAAVGAITSFFVSFLLKKVFFKEKGSNK